MPMQREVFTPLFDDAYKGPRWAYGMSHRSLGFSNQPKGNIIRNPQCPSLAFDLRPKDRLGRLRRCTT